MRKFYAIILMVVILTLAGCNVEYDAGEESTPTSVEKVYKIGEEVVQKKGQTYIYGGILGSSIVLTCLGSTEYGDVYTYPIYIEKSANKVTLENGITIEVKKVEVETNQATILVTK